MSKTSRKSASLSTDAIQMIRGLIIGKVMTLVVIGGLWFWLRPRTYDHDYAVSASQQFPGTNRTGSSFAGVPNVPMDTFNYGGSTAWAPIRQLVNSQIQHIRPEFQLVYVNPAVGSPGSGTGIKMLLEGKLDFTESSRPLSSAEQTQAQKQGLKLAQRQVGLDAVGVVVNPELPVSGLTVNQLQQIYLGQITNWQQVGGPNLPIVPLSQSPENADTLLFPDKSADKQSLSSRVQYVYSTTEALRRIKTTPGSLYYASARGVVYQCNAKLLPLGLTSQKLVSLYSEPVTPSNQCPQQRNRLNIKVIQNGSYPLISALYVIVKQNQGREQQAGEAYAKLLLTDQGQQAIAQAGFVPVNSQEISFQQSQK
ncbi:PstS family phosphate ABC transporter substrate-binding protein [Nostoc sp. FACHB-110]|uniref:PstS family phosphate ABC transporter substrate-binding protein n=1 Tax=Nostoc sp. FACHB-110 TaxID=2692834 RepID=UPI0016877C35|nr:substrate-binding domain-containing protein [Nostoc sp. FACHB-110]MBD2436901.1 substrate-binding domain-containing protein [Nostoc sp. FACHB-110]